MEKVPSLFLSLDDRCDVKIGGFGLMKNGRNTRLGSRSPDDQRGKLSVRWMARESITDSIFTSMTDMVRTYSHTPQKKPQTGIFSSCFLWGHWYPCFGLLVTSALCFKARVYSLSCVLRCLCAICSSHSPLVRHLLTSFFVELKLWE